MENKEDKDEQKKAPKKVGKFKVFLIALFLIVLFFISASILSLITNAITGKVSEMLGEEGDVSVSANP